MTATETTETTAARKPPPWIEKAQDLSRFHWTERWLELDKLVTFRLGETDDGFQRPLQERRVQYLVDHFDAGEARVIFVSRRDKEGGEVEYVILDGQHTAAACQRVGMTHMATRIFYNMTLEDEASHFIEYQANSRKIPGVVQHNAEVIASSPEAVAIENILRPFYLRISTAKLRNEDGYIPIASRAMFEKLLDISPAVLKEVLQLSVDAWGHNRESFNSRIMAGLGYLLATAYTSSGQAPFDRQRMLAVLKNTTPRQNRGKNRAYGFGWCSAGRGGCPPGALPGRQCAGLHQAQRPYQDQPSGPGQVQHQERVRGARLLDGRVHRLRPHHGHALRSPACS